MADYLLYHINRSSLSRDIVTLVDSYTKKEISEDMLQKYVRSWSENCPNLIFDDGNHDAISPKLVRLIGKKRSLIILTVLKNTK